MHQHVHERNLSGKDRTNVQQEFSLAIGSEKWIVI